MSDADLTDRLQSRVRDSAPAATALCIVGGNSKAFYGRTPEGEPLQVGDHRGIISYEPTELVVTARAGTPLSEIENALAEQHQMLAFEPPHFGETATLGGTIACGLSGPRRPYAGAARDFVLGTTILTGTGDVLRFGGQVMKNVAGYDVARLMCGALGTLGVLLDVSLKVLPRPAQERTLIMDVNGDEALDLMQQWAGKPLPLSAACHDGERLYVRLSGSPSAVEAARRRMGGETLDRTEMFWTRLRELKHGFFDSDRPLWRISVAPGAPALPLRGKWFLDWGGAQRWLYSDEPARRVREAAARAGGHAALFRGGERSGDVFHQPAAAVMKMHKRLKARFDPKGILNPRRLFAQL